MSNNWDQRRRSRWWRPSRGVSRSTVSRVVNGSPRVTSGAAEAVNRAIVELNYVPNRAARALASRKTQAIALVIPANTTRFFADPFFASVSQGIAMHLATTDYTLSMLIASETDSGKTRRYLQGGNVDGALILSHHRDDRSYTHARNLHSTTSTPPLTTMAQPSVALGSRMAEILVRLITGGTAERLTIMPTVLVERESV